MINLTILICMFLGVAVRTVIPALRKWADTSADGAPFTWDNRYTVTLIISLIVSVISALTIYQTFSIPESDIVNVGAAAFFAGLGLNSGIDELSKWVTKAF